MKKTRILSVLLTLSMMTSAAVGCGDSSSDPSTDGGSSQVETTEEETTAEATTAPPTTTKKVVTTAAPTTQPKKNLKHDDVFSDPVFYLIPPNSAGGLQYLWADKYTGSKTVNYYTTTYEMINAVGDPAYDDIKNKSTFSVRTVGPINTGDYLLDISKDNPTAYCSVCSKLKLTKVELEYSDGTTDTVDYGYSTSMLQDTAWSNVWLGIQTYHPDFYSYLN